MYKYFKVIISILVSITSLTSCTNKGFDTKLTETAHLTMLYTETPTKSPELTATPTIISTPTINLPTFSPIFMTSTPNSLIYKSFLETTPFINNTYIAENFSDVKITDNIGRVTIQDSISNSIVTIIARNKVTDEFISSIQVNYFSDGISYFVIGIDTKGKYMPSIIEGSYAASSNNNSNPENESQINLVSLQYANKNDSLDEVIRFMDFVGVVSTLTDLASILVDMPSLEGSSLFYNDLCMTGKQMASTFGVFTGLVDIGLFPLKGDLIKSVWGKVITAMVGATLPGLVIPSQQFLSEQPGAYLLRFYTFPVPFTILLVEVMGMCTQPDMTSEIIMFDTRKEIAYSNQKLYLGQPYEVKVTGTFSYWDINYWRTYGLCRGQTESNVIYLQNDISSCLASHDPEYSFAIPKGPGYPNCEKVTTPSRDSVLQFSLNGQLNFANLKPKNTSLNINDHSYLYTIIGQGKPLIIHLRDSIYQDNCGELKFEISPVNN